MDGYSTAQTHDSTFNVNDIREDKNALEFSKETEQFILKHFSLIHFLIQICTSKDLFFVVLRYFQTFRFNLFQKTAKQS